MDMIARDQKVSCLTLKQFSNSSTRVEVLTVQNGVYFHWWIHICCIANTTSKTWTFSYYLFEVKRNAFAQ